MAAKGMQQIRLTAVLVAALAFLGSCAHHRARVGPASANLPAPALVSPRDQAVLTNHPRTIRFAWSRVPQAAAYGIEIDCLGCCAHGQWCSDVPGKAYIVPNLTAITYSFTFWGDQRGRWRVWAIDARSRPGAKSGWSAFAFRPNREDTDSKKPSPFPRQ